MHSADIEPIKPSVAAAILGVSKGMVYLLAAPNGPIPCSRIGRRIVFNKQDLMEYLAACRFTEIKREVVSSLNSTALLKVSVSGLESSFRKLGIKPKLTPSTGKSRRGSIQSQVA